MKFYISYFYQLRFFPTNLIPISTAKWDPFWYKGGGVPFLDKRGVINGLRAPILNLPEESFIPDEMCGRPCTQSPPNCSFMAAYRKYLNTLDFNDIIVRAERLANFANDNLIKTDKELEVAFMVYESKTCKCAERPVLQEWFLQNGLILPEWEKN